jgi:isoquinoline 1-oxidoreductase subunit beta
LVLRSTQTRVEQSNFDTYRVLRMNEALAIEVHIVQSAEPPGGMGETGTSATGALKQPA